MQARREVYLPEIFMTCRKCNGRWRAGNIKTTKNNKKPDTVQEVVISRESFQMSEIVFSLKLSVYTF